MQHRASTLIGTWLGHWPQTLPDHGLSACAPPITEDNVFSCKKKKSKKAAAAAAAVAAAEGLLSARDSARSSVADAGKSASSRLADARDTAAAKAADVKDSAGDHASDLVTEALAILGPLLATATHKAGQLKDLAAENAQPSKIAPLASQARDAAAHTAKETLLPMAAVAAAKGVGFAQQAKDTLTPHVQDAASRAQSAAQPYLDQAKDRVQSDLIPQITDLLHQAAEHPAVHEANSRGKATLAALRGDLVVPEEPQQKGLVRRTIGGAAKVAAVGAVLAAVTVAARQFLASKDDGWTAYDASPNYEAAKQADASDASDASDAPAAPDVEVEAQPEAVMTDEGGPVDDDIETVSSDDQVADLEHPASDVEGDPVEARTYGEGAHVGDNPPEGYTVKGNERSMKYHTSDSTSYDRTIADVWFVDEAAAEANGFTRAQR